MNKLELKHLAPYLAYGLELFIDDEIGRVKLTGLSTDFIITTELVTPINLVTPYLRPLSNLTKEITVNGETFVPIVKLLHPRYKITSECKIIGSSVVWIDMSLLSLDHLTLLKSEFEKLYSWHFDLNNLLDQNLAIDINTIQK